MNNASTQTGKMVRLAILVAVIVLMAFTPLGYLKILAIEITFMMIPVAVAAISVGPFGGAVAGGVFGVTSFIQCFGMSWFGSMLFSINPVFTFIMCIVPRVLAGWLPGLLYSALTRKGNNITFTVVAASLAAPLLNTVLFIGSLFLFFGNTDFIRGFGDTTWSIIVLLVGVNGIIEAGVGIVTGTVVGRTLVHLFPESAKSGKQAA